jgi:C1A family cysteine protease
MTSYINNTNVSDHTEHNQTSKPVKTMSKYTYGHKKDRVDINDIKIEFTDAHVANFLSSTDHPSEFNLLNIINLPPEQLPYDQGKLGSCTANGIAFCYVFDELKQHNKVPFMPSRLFIYYNERLIENSVSDDSGGEIRDGIKSLQTYGVCDESIWPYNAPLFTTKPEQLCYTEAKNCKGLRNLKIDFSKDTTKEARANHLKRALKSGYPVVFGFQVFASFESDEVAKSGIVPMPQPNEESVGGHCTVLVGYSDITNTFLVRNSWGPLWGDGGYFHMPSDYVTDLNLCSDFWILSSVSNPTALLNGESPSSGIDLLQPNNINLDPNTNSGGVVHNN